MVSISTSSKKSIISIVITTPSEQAADTLAQALALRGSLAVHESVITREGIWVGRQWLRVARDTDEKAGVLERERDVARDPQAGVDPARREQLRARVRVGALAVLLGRQRLVVQLRQVGLALSQHRQHTPDSYASAQQQGTVAAAGIQLPTLVDEGAI